jgi:hypothetical protein
MFNALKTPCTNFITWEGASDVPREEMVKEGIVIFHWVLKKH